MMNPFNNLDNHGWLGGETVFFFSFFLLLLLFFFFFGFEFCVRFG